MKKSAQLLACLGLISGMALAGTPAWAEGDGRGHGHGWKEGKKAKLAACEEKAEGDTCEFTGRQGAQIQGTCVDKRGKGRLMCMNPEHMQKMKRMHENRSQSEG